MKILITGANGFVGRALCADLTARGHHVLAVTHRAASGLAGSEVVQLDLSGPIDTARLPADCDAIVHLAQSARFRDFPAGARDMFDVNVRSTMDLLEYARTTGVRRFVYASSGGIYGQGADAFSESEPLVMTDSLGFYLTSKLAGELLVDNYASQFSVATLRIFFAYGPGQQPDRLIPRLLQNVRDGRPVTLEGEEGLSINPIYIDDVVEVVNRVVASGETFKLNVGGAETLSLRQIAVAMGEIVGRAPRFEQKPAAQSPKLVGDIAHMVAKLGYEPRIGFAEGARRLYARRGDDRR